MGDKRLRVNLSDLMNPLWETYDINVVPTVILFEDERIEGRLDGTLGMGLSVDQLEEFFESTKKS